jgi:hypothetical protein
MNKGRLCRPFGNPKALFLFVRAAIPRAFWYPGGTYWWIDAIGRQKEKGPR